MDTQKNTVVLKTPEEKQIAFEQYKIIVESINQLHNARETSNNFWTAANGLVISAISYGKTISELTSIHNGTLVGSLLLIGGSFCLCWISYLNTIRKSLNIRYEILIETENYFPLKVFQKAYGQVNRKEGNKSLSFKELLVPFIILSAYTFFILDFFFGFNIYSFFLPSLN